MTPLHIPTYGSGISVVFLHGSFGWGVQAFPKQVALQRRHRLLFVDRRGFGQSPDAVPRVDFDIDTCDLIDIVEPLGEPAHLVGHSYGAVPCLLMAEQRRKLIRSITLVEPSAFSLVRGNPSVEEFISRIYRSIETSAGLSAKGFLEDFIGAMGYDKPDLPEPDSVMARSIAASATERRPWEAEIDLARLKRSGIPTLIVSGSWSGAPPEAQRIAGAAFHAVAEMLERELPAERLIVSGASHNPQMVASIFNPLVEEFWMRAETKS